MSDKSGKTGTDASEPPILVADDLTLATASGQTLVEGIGFALRRGESIGLVGESGSGKSLTLRAVLGLLPKGVTITRGSVRHSVRSAMVFQDPRGALDPLCPVVKQVAEVVRYRQNKNRREARAEALKLLGLLGLPESLAREDRYPNQLSGGQCQRIVIALALACRPDILLCDEPTTALDVTVQRQIIDLIARLQSELGFAMIFVTHNLAIAAEMCSRLIVMKQGRVVEEGPSVDVLTAPRDPYTRMLIEALLQLPETAGAAGTDPALTGNANRLNGERTDAEAANHPSLSGEDGSGASTSDEPSAVEAAKAPSESAENAARKEDSAISDSETESQFPTLGSNTEGEDPR
ncbi:peptide ABC transporter ATP-binding protein [Saccharibacillus sp. O23]|uniref:ABC transporter ATP-binding protein n=1 Tax=Saccharibacillus sp. O23 TaxID=2009338 RepID=UPI000B4E09C9|nr:ABC transporter ATP-binding protein [Saccharibacillus sp. O23]OWR30990.1 peptide ABC transporter ATP-binding protein [Saccharibacillus sp. O23]